MLFNVWFETKKFVEQILEGMRPCIGISSIPSVPFTNQVVQYRRCISSPVDISWAIGWILRMSLTSPNQKALHSNTNPNTIWSLHHFPALFILCVKLSIRPVSKAQLTLRDQHIGYKEGPALRLTIYRIPLSTYLQTKLNSIFQKSFSSPMVLQKVHITKEYLMSVWHRVTMGRNMAIWATWPWVDT